MDKKNNTHISATASEYISGMRDGIPIGLGYLAVSFSLGIAARNAGLSPLQGFIASLLCNASAGEYAGFTLIASGAAYIEMILMTVIVNARYILMSCAMSQRMNPNISLIHRLLMSFDITDELFGIVISRDGYLSPFYMYGAVTAAAPCWAVGTALGTITGNILPASVVSCLSVALFGMFLAVIIPPAKKDRVIAMIIAICFTASYGSAHIPGLSSMTDGTRTILLTVVISAAAAIIFPKNNESNGGE